jgi:hypothetical protein
MNADDCAAASPAGTLKPPPSGRRKFAFWLIAGMLSVVCVEVPAGSTMFPFFTLWGLLVVWPLYLLHSVFFAGLVFRFGRPGFWPLYSAGMIYGMYEAYITKVVWTSFRPQGPMFDAGGVALFETIICALFLHPLLAFIVPLLFTEIALTNSNEVLSGFPQWLRKSIVAHPMRWAAALTAMFGLMQFVNSPSVASSLLSGAGNGIVIAFAVLWWRRAGGAAYSLRELLPGSKGLKIYGGVLLVWYIFWGFAIKPKSIPPILHGQLTVWIIYAALLWIFYGCLVHSRKAPYSGDAGALAFNWRGLFVCFAVGTVITAAARLFLYPFLSVQYVVFFTFYVIVGLGLLAGAIFYASDQHSGGRAS